LTGGIVILDGRSWRAIGVGSSRTTGPVGAGHEQRAGLLRGEPVVLLAEACPCRQCGLSVLLQLPYDDAVLGPGELVLAAAGPLAGVVRALETPLPDPVHLVPLRLDLLGGGEGHFQCWRG
jgi:hypothetical protein